MPSEGTDNRTIHVECHQCGTAAWMYVSDYARGDRVKCWQCSKPMMAKAGAYVGPVKVGA